MRPMSVLSLRLCHPDIRDYRKKVTWQTNLNPDNRETGFWPHSEPLIAFYRNQGKNPGKESRETLKHLGPLCRFTEKDYDLSN